MRNGHIYNYFSKNLKEYWKSLVFGWWGSDWEQEDGETSEWRIWAESELDLEV